MTAPDWTTTRVDLAQTRLGAEVCWATDEFFGAKERLIDPASPIFVPGRYDDHGKWMDGWETRRLRGPGHDHCVIRLGLAGRIRGIDLDTSFFDGNQPAAASLDAASSDDPLPADSDWQEILARSDLGPNRHHYLEISDPRTWSHVRLHIYPDGGVARLRVYGDVEIAPETADPEAPIDLVAVENGGRALAWSDQHFGAAHKLLLPGRGLDMGDGWETRRRRRPGHDWVLVALGRVGFVREILLDTAHFKGNYPDRASVEGILASQDAEPARLLESADWRVLLPEQRLGADAEHRFDQLLDGGPFSHVRVNVFPDGGLSRVRLLGEVT